MKTLGLIILAVGCIANANGVGNGGDPLRTIFDEAKKYAADRIQNANSCSFGVNTRPEVVQWIMAHKTDLAQDVQTSVHTWVTDSQATCAFTTTQRNAPVTLSFVACRPQIKNVTDAIQIVTHESVHHFGIADESFADQVGIAIARIGVQSTCSTPSANPFDPNSCPGTRLTSSDLYSLIPLPETNVKELGKFKVYTRERKCYGPNFCAAWVDQKGVFSGDPLRDGRASIRLMNNIPQVWLFASVADPGAYNPFTWNTSSHIENNFELVTDYSAQGHLMATTPGSPVYLARTKLNNVLGGWITNSCLRQTASDSYAAKDDLNNDITVETEMVILSNFSN